MIIPLQDIGNYELRKVARTDVKGLTVSTAYTSDEGFETAIIDENGAHPVERYSTEEEARSGHYQWCENAKTIVTVTKLGSLGADNRDIVLFRKGGPPYKGSGRYCQAQ